VGRTGASTRARSSSCDLEAGAILWVGMTKNFHILFVSAIVVLVATVSILKVTSQRTWKQAWDDLLQTVLGLLGQ